MRKFSITDFVLACLIGSAVATQMGLILGYEGWGFDKGEAAVGDLIVDGKTIFKKWK